MSLMSMFLLLTGMGMGAFALGNGMRHAILGNSNKFRNMMKLVVLSQFFAVVSFQIQMSVSANKRAHNWPALDDDDDDN